MSYPVTLEVDYVEKRSRLTTFFRILLVIPWLIVGFFYEIGLLFAVIAAWFVLLFTGRWPLGMYNFVAGVLRYLARVNAFLLLLVDPFPPFVLDHVPTYPARLLVDPPQASYSRLLVFFRVIYVIPAYLIAYVLGIVSYVIWFFDWFVIVILGKQLPGFQNAQLFCVAYSVRAQALMFLLTEKYPPFNP
jgi:hypothetical protein